MAFTLNITEDETPITLNMEQGVGPSGPNQVSSTTSTNLTGALVGNGSAVSSVPYGTTATASALVQRDASGSVPAHIVAFDTSNGGPVNTGEVGWLASEETLTVALVHGTMLNLGEEELWHVDNVTGSTIADGTPVMYAGTVGNSGKMRVKVWDGTDIALFMGIATSTIADDDAGYVCHRGKVRGIQTNGANYGETWATGDEIYAFTGDNYLTNIKPTGGAGYVALGVVVSAHASNGTIAVRQQRIPSGTEVGGTQSPTEGRLVKYNSGGALLAKENVSVIKGTAAAEFRVDNVTASTIATLQSPNASGTLALTAQTDGTIRATDLDYANTADIGAALADADEIFVADGGGNTTRVKSALSRFKTYIAAWLDGALTIAGAKTWSGAQTINADLTVTAYTESVVSIGNSGTSQTIAITSGTFQTVTLTGNCTFTMPTATAGKSFILKVLTGAGGYTAVFTGVKWSGGVAPTITAAASKYDLISFIADGSSWSGSLVQNFTA